MAAAVMQAASLERLQLQFEVEQWLYEEAALLDARRFREWLGLLCEDIHYWMPVRRTVMNSDLDLEFTKPGEIAYFDDDYSVLVMRVGKLEASSAWAEDPASRARHFVNNVRITAISGDEMTIEVAFRLDRSRLESESDFWTGRRTDVLRRVDGELRLARRHIYLDQTVIRSTNMSVLF